MVAPDYCENYEKLYRIFFELYDMAQDYALDDEHPLTQARLAILEAMHDIEESNT